MPSLYNADLKPIGANEKTHYYDHATKLFVADNLRLAPKQTFLYYVVFNINQSIAAGLTSMIGASTDAISTQSLFEQYEAGLMVKRIDLPKFSIANKTYNAYNRKNIVINSIAYDPISVTFHDDAANVVNKFWNDYYTYYYRDSDYNQELYNVPHKYQPRLRSKWGFTPLNRQLISFLRDIQIFSLHNKRFTEYRLINPVITSWRHGIHDSGSNNDTMSNSMTINYETVKYRVGTVNPVDVNGFSVLHYDTTPSPISTSTTNIYTNAGILGAIGTAGSQDLARPDGQGSGRGLFSSVLGAYNLYNNAKNINLKSVAQLTIGQYGAGAINAALNGNFSGQVFPTATGNPGTFPFSTSNVDNPSNVTNNPYSLGLPVAIGGAVALSQGASTTTGAGPAIQEQAEVQRGVSGYSQSPFAAVVGQISNAQPNIPLNPLTGQPNVNSTQLLTLNSNGAFTPSAFSLSANGFNPADVTANQVKAPTIFNDGSGFPVTLRTYADGSSVAFDSNNNALYTIPAGSKAYTPVELNQLNANALRSLNVNQQTGTRFITNPTTGVVTAVGGTTAMISNTLSQGLGAAGGVVAGQRVYEALARTGLGKSMIGQVVIGGVSTAVSGAVYKAANNFLQPILNTGVGYVGQVFDEATKSIRNLSSIWNTNGGYNASNWTENLKETVYEPGGGIRYEYQNGETLYEDAAGNIVRSAPESAPGNFWSRTFGDPAAATSPESAPIIDRSTFDGALAEAGNNAFGFGGDY